MRLKKSGDENGNVDQSFTLRKLLLVEMDSENDAQAGKNDIIWTSVYQEEFPKLLLVSLSCVSVLVVL